MQHKTKRQLHERWLKELTALPTAAGKEQRVIEWIERWTTQRRDLVIRRDKAGNLFITQKRAARSKLKPIFITAHLDHPAFVVRQAIDASTVELEFRGGVNDPYFKNAPIEVFDDRDRAHRAKIVSLDPLAKPFKRVHVRLTKAARTIKTGDVGWWVFANHASLPRISKGLLHTHACDDLAAVAAALATLDVLRTQKDAANVGLLFTRAEEIGFIGAIAACKNKSVPKNARLICLENSRSFAESPIGGGPIVRVGDKMSVFGPNLTNRISAIMMEHQRVNPQFKWQRKLMPGGTCEATTFSTYGYESTCLCLPLGNYHNMQDIDGVQAGKRPAKVGPEFISVEDYHGLIHMLVICSLQLDSAKIPSLTQRMEELHAKYRDVLR